MKSILIFCLFLFSFPLLADDVTFIVTNETSSNGMSTSNGSIKVTVNNNSGFLQPFLVSWTGPLSGSASFSGSMYTITNLKAGTYCVQVSTLDGCVLKKCMPLLFCHPISTKPGEIAYIRCDTIPNLEPGGGGTFVVNPFDDDNDHEVKGRNSTTLITEKNLIVNLFPNPTSDLITLESNSNIEKIIIYNDRGLKIKEIVSVNSNESLYQIDLQGNYPGIYFIVISSDKGRVVRKVVKI